MHNIKIVRRRIRIILRIPIRKLTLRNPQRTCIAFI